MARTGLLVIKTTNKVELAAGHDPDGFMPAQLKKIVKDALPKAQQPGTSVE